MFRLVCVKDVIASSWPLRSALLLLMTLYVVMTAEHGPNLCLKCRHESVKSISPTNKTRAEQTIKKDFGGLQAGDSNCLTLASKVEEVRCPLSAQGVCQLMTVKIHVERGDEKYEVNVISRDCIGTFSDDRKCYPADTGDIPSWIKDLRNVEPLTTNGPRFSLLSPSGDNCYCNATNACNDAKFPASDSERAVARWTAVMVISAIATITNNY